MMFNGIICGNKCCRFNEDSLYYYNKMSYVLLKYRTPTQTKRDMPELHIVIIHMHFKLEIKHSVG